MIRRHPWYSLMLLALLVLAALAWHNRVHLQAFPDILGAYSAKEYCSCRYVSAQPAEYCTGYVQQYLPLGELTDNEALKQVSASAMGRHHVAVWQDSRRGCILLSPAQAQPE